MKYIVRVIFLLVAITPCCAENKPKLSDRPLNQEQQAIYIIFLSSYSNGAGTVVNLSNQTEPFQPSDIDLKGCMNGIDLAPTDSNAVHLLSSNILPDRGYQLVDSTQQLKNVKKNDPGTGIKHGKPVEEAVREGFAAGLLSLSEIAFSQDHRYAFLQYSFYCGSLCGNGALKMYEKDGDGWKVAKGKFCSFSMN